MSREQKVVAYEAIYLQDTSTMYNQRDSKVADAIATFFGGVDGSNFLDGKDAFLTFTPNLLMQNVPQLFNDKKLVIQVADDVLIHPHAKDILRRHKEKGFRIALLDFEFNKRYLDILPLVDFMKVDFSDPDKPGIEDRLTIAGEYRMKSVAFNLNTSVLRDKAYTFNFDYFQGSSVADVIKSKVRKVEHLQSNFFRLMAEISKPTPDFDEIARIVSMDVTLTFSVLRLVNSAYFALPNRVKDVKQALTILGLGQLRHWIYLLSFSSDADISDELIKNAFLRATLCQELSQYSPGFPVKRTDAYLLGMFSMLDALLQVDINEAVKDLPIAQEIKDGLTGKEGKCRSLLRLCVAYENGEWSEMGHKAEELSIPLNIIAQKYLETVEYVTETWDELTKPFFKG